LEILDAGINVISTVNVQHFESLNDTVFEITGVRVREMLPDSIIDNADEVVLVDLTPSALLNRLKRGDVYALAKVPTALQNFFRPGNLGALRELALRKTAEEVDEQLREYMEEQRIAEAWRTQERVVVCVTPCVKSTKLIRRGYQIARRLSGVFWTVYVRTPGSLLPQREETMLQELFELTRNLGGEMVELEGESIADAVVRFAVEHQVTTIVMGQSIRSRLEEMIKGNLISRVMREAKHVDVLVVSETDIAAAFRGVKRRSSQNHQDNNVERMLALDVMRADVVTVTKGTSIRDAAKLMIERGIGALPVLNDQRHLVGIVTRRDIVRAI
jgi:two-component system sensor histidine kinase KdpD